MPRAAHSAARRAGRVGLGSRRMIALHVMARSAARCAERMLCTRVEHRRVQCSRRGARRAKMKKKGAERQGVVGRGSGVTCVVCCSASPDGPRCRDKKKQYVSSRRHVQSAVYDDQKSRPLSTVVRTRCRRTAPPHTAARAPTLCSLYSGLSWHHDARYLGSACAPISLNRWWACCSCCNGMSTPNSSSSLSPRRTLEPARALALVAFEL